MSLASPGQRCPGGSRILRCSRQSEGPGLPAGPGLQQPGQLHHRRLQAREELLRGVQQGQGGGPGPGPHAVRGRRHGRWPRAAWTSPRAPCAGHRAQAGPGHRRATASSPSRLPRGSGSPGTAACSWGKMASSRPCDGSPVLGKNGRPIKVDPAGGPVNVLADGTVQQGENTARRARPEGLRQALRSSTAPGPTGSTRAAPRRRR